MSSEDLLPLDEAIQFQQGTEDAAVIGGTNGGIIDVARPTASGLLWLAVPSTCVGLAYRIQGDGTTLEAISFSSSNNDDASNKHNIILRFELSVPVVSMCCSADGRLIVVACMDGSLQCIDATSNALILRWVRPEAHSHVVSDLRQSVSTSRNLAASKAGPVHSLSFAPSGHVFLLADAGAQRLSIYDASSSSPVNLIPNLMSLQVLSAAWSTATTTRDDEYDLAVGTIDGSIVIYSIVFQTGSTTKISTIPPPTSYDNDVEMTNDFVPTHLDWFARGTSLAVGYCRCLPHDDGNDDDEDDPADHDAVLYVGSMTENYKFVNPTNVGEVVSFFSVPRNGRHVFFTSYASPTTTTASNHEDDTRLLCVASNVASDVGVVVVVDSNSQWQAIDLQEGYGASCPTDEDDEFTFPMGIATIQVPNENDDDEMNVATSLLLASTDGSLCCFQITNQNNPKAFYNAPLSQQEGRPGVYGVAALPTTPLDKLVVEAARSAPGTPPLSSELVEEVSVPPSTLLANQSQLSSTTERTETKAPTEATPTVFGSGTSSGLSFGAGGTTAPAFGQTSALGVGATASSPFGQTTGSAAGALLGSSSSSPYSPATPAFGSGSSVPVFGSSSSSTPGAGGFAALASSPKASTGFGSENPFGAFGKSGRSMDMSSMVKPLFGDSGTSKAKEEAKSNEDVVEKNEPSEKGTEQAHPSEKDEKAPVVERTTAPASDDQTSMPSLDQTDDPGAKKAARVFDSFDEKKEGTLPIAVLEDMMDELGEGMHGDEFDAQKALIDPRDTKKVDRSAFIEWYVNLLAGHGSDDDNASLDSDEREEWEEEKEKAEDAFSSLATNGENGKPAISKNEFGLVIAKLGTTYCEEEHRKTIEKLSQADDMIYEDDFITWYRNWLFSIDDDISDEEEEETDEDNAEDTQTSRTSSAKGWGSLFLEEGDTWRCENCMVRNAQGATKCASCETPRPGVALSAAADETAHVAKSTAANGSSIGEGGFSFGGGSSQSVASSFAASASASDIPLAESSVTDKSSIGTGGFTFGSGSGFSFGAPKPDDTSARDKSDDSTDKSSIGKGGFTFGSGSGFSFGAPKVDITSAKDKSDDTSSSIAPSKPGGTSEIPPMPKAATTPFSTAKANALATTESTGASSYPPSSKASALPGGAKSGSTAVKKSSASYPPISANAPTPFGVAKTSAPAKSGSTGVKKSSGSYPPMSAKAPTPFGVAKTSAPAKSGANAVKKSSGSYPPISAKAPTPFGVAKTSAPIQPEPALSFSTAHSLSSEAQAKPTKPDDSSKAPAPAHLSSTKTKEKQRTSIGASSYPPLSTKAPVPFGGGSSRSVPLSSKSSTSSAYPPLSSKAPSSFSAGIPSTSAPSKTKAPSTFTSSAYPPLSSKAPSPFGAGITSTSAPPKTKAPSTFSSTAKTSAVASSKVDKPSTTESSTSGFPPLPVSATKTGAPVPSSKSSRQSASISVSSPWRKSASSEYESHFRKVIEKFEVSFSKVANNRFTAGRAKEESANFEKDIEKMAEQNASLVTSCNDLGTQVARQKGRSLFLLGRRTDIERQISESRRLIDAQTSSRETQARVMETQPLDAESERSRRSLAVKALMVNRTLEFLENRNSLLRGMCVVDGAGGLHSAVALTQEDRKNIVLEEMISTFRRTQRFEEDVRRTSRRVTEYAQSIPAVESGLQTTALPQSHSSRKSLSARKSRHRLTPISAAGTHRKSALRSSSGQRECMEKWAKLEQTMRKTEIRAVPAKRLSRVPQLGASSAPETSKHQGRAARTQGPSLLMSPTQGPHTGKAGVCQERLVFSSPLNNARSDWNAATDTDQEKMKNVSLAFPRHLKNVDAGEASRDALSTFGTTPEEAIRASELKKKGASCFGTTTEKTASSKAPLSMGKPSGRGSEAKLSSSYPPIAKQPPKPFSGGTKSANTAPAFQASKSVEAGVGASKSPLALQPKNSFPSLSRSATIDEKRTDTKSASAFGDLKGLGDSLFAEESKPLSSQCKSERNSMGLSGITPDYRQTLIDFYTAHNPARLNEVDKALAKYKGREVEMFEKLARKYNVPNPLDSTGTEVASSSAFMTPSSPLTSPVAPMPTSSTSTAPAFGENARSGFQNTSPIVSSSPSPFGAAVTPTPSNPSPFGQTAPATGAMSAFAAAPSTSPFGPPSSSPSPFGQPVTQSAPAPSSAAPALIGGREPREVLVAFYQKYNPAKLNEVDNLLLKYKGDEERLFRNLAKKYNLDPSMFGLPSAPAPSSPTAFGQTSALGVGAGVFGQTAQSFGGSSTPGFGQTSSLGSNQSIPTFGTPSAAGGQHAFGSASAMGGAQSTFGSLAQPAGTQQQTTPFGGGMQQTGGFGSLSAGTGGFGGSGGAFGSGGAATHQYGGPRR